MFKALRFFLHTFLEPSVHLPSRSEWFAKILATIILLNILTMILETVPEFSSYYSVFFAFETLSLLFFTVEYGLRIWVSPLSIDFSGYLNALFKKNMIIDGLVLLPFLVSFIFPMAISFEMLMIFRIFRLLRLPRYFDSVHRILHIIYRHRSDLWSAMLIIFFAILLGATAMYHAEHLAQPDKFSSIIHAFYWGVVTFATIGYGDIVPVTFFGKIITVCISFFGVLLYTLPTYIIGSAFYEEIRSKQALEMNRLKEIIKQLEAENKSYRHAENAPHTSFVRTSHHDSV